MLAKVQPLNGEWPGLLRSVLAGRLGARIRENLSHLGTNLRPTNFRRHFWGQAVSGLSGWRLAVATSVISSVWGNSERKKLNEKSFHFNPFHLKIRHTVRMLSTRQ